MAIACLCSRIFHGVEWDFNHHEWDLFMGFVQWELMYGFQIMKDECYLNDGALFGLSSGYGQ